MKPYLLVPGKIKVFDMLIMCIVLITDAWINCHRRSDVISLVNMAAAFSVGNFCLILTYSINSCLWFAEPENVQMRAQDILSYVKGLFFLEAKKTNSISFLSASIFTWIP